MKILITGAARIGDAVMSLPALSAVVRSFPQASFSLFAPGASAGVYRCSGLECPVIPVVSGGISLLRRFLGLRDFHYDRAILFSGGFIWALGAGLAGVRERIGLDSDWRGGLLTRKVGSGTEEQHQCSSYLELAAAAGASTAGVMPPGLSLPVHERAAAGRFLQERLSGRRYFCVNPGASRASKRWPLQRFIRVCSRLQERGLGCVVLGGGSDARLARRLVGALGGGCAVSAAGEPLVRSFALLAGACFYIGNNSGLSHAAAALRVPGVCISGPSSFQKTVPQGAPVFFLGGAAVSGSDRGLRPHPALLAVTVEEVILLLKKEFRDFFDPL